MFIFKSCLRSTASQGEPVILVGEDGAERYLKNKERVISELTQLLGAKNMSEARVERFKANWPHIKLEYAYDGSLFFKSVIGLLVKMEINGE